MQNYKTAEQRSIDRKSALLKKQWEKEFPVCIFCRHYVKPGEGQLAHKIRRSEVSEKHSRYALQTMPLNTGLAHDECHHIYDNVPQEAILLPGFPYVMNDIALIDPGIYRRQMVNLYGIAA